MFRMQEVAASSIEGGSLQHRGWQPPARWVAADLGHDGRRVLVADELLSPEQRVEGVAAGHLCVHRVGTAWASRVHRVCIPCAYRVHRVYTAWPWQHVCRTAQRVIGEGAAPVRANGMCMACARHGTTGDGGEGAVQIIAQRVGRGGG